MITSRFIKVHPDALLEYIWDDDFNYANDYSVVKDVLNNESSFVFSSNITDTENYNKLPNQLYLIDGLINRYGIMNPETKTFLQESKFVNNQASRFDKVKIQFPINYNFQNFIGFFIKIYGKNFENVDSYNLCNFFLDINEPGDLNKIDLETQPIRINEKLQGKSITLYIPSLYEESRLRINNKPKIGSINYNLTNGILGLSQTSPVSIDFRFLTSKSTLANEKTYLTTPPLIITLPQAPEYNNLSVEINEATDGDYFLINGVYNGSVGEFDNFMKILEDNGKKSYIIFSITVFEENIQQDTYDMYVYKDFYKKRIYKPVLLYTNTTASLLIEMKLINSVDSSVISKFTDFTLVGNNVTKYGKKSISINISNAIKPKLYNSKPDILTLPAQDFINKHLQKKINYINNEIKYVSYPVLTEIYNIVIQDLTIKNNKNIFYGNGQLQLQLSPFDNIFKLKIAKNVTDNNYEPFSINSSNVIVQLVFKSDTNEVKIPLYTETNEVDLNSGILIFKILSSQINIISNINKINNNFYITLLSNEIESLLYSGSFVLLNEKTQIQNNNLTDISNPTIVNNNEIIKQPAKAIEVKQEQSLNFNDKGKNYQEKILNNNLNSEQIKRLK